MLVLFAIIIKFSISFTRPYHPVSSSTSFKRSPSSTKSKTSSSSSYFNASLTPVANYTDLRGKIVRRTGKHYPTSTVGLFMKSIWQAMKYMMSHTFGIKLFLEKMSGNVSESEWILESTRLWNGLIEAEILGGNKNVTSLSRVYSTLSTLNMSELATQILTADEMAEIQFMAAINLGLVITTRESKRLKGFLGGIGVYLLKSALRSGPRGILGWLNDFGFKEVVEFYRSGYWINDFLSLEPSISTLTPLDIFASAIRKLSILKVLERKNVQLVLPPLNINSSKDISSDNNNHVNSNTNNDNSNNNSHEEDGSNGSIGKNSLNSNSMSLNCAKLGREAQKCNDWVGVWTLGVLRAMAEWRNGNGDDGDLAFWEAERALVKHTAHDSNGIKNLDLSRRCVSLSLLAYAAARRGKYDPAKRALARLDSILTVISKRRKKMKSHQQQKNIIDNDQGSYPMSSLSLSESFMQRNHSDVDRIGALIEVLALWWAQEAIKLSKTHDGKKCKLHLRKTLPLLTESPGFSILVSRVKNSL